MVPLTPRTSFLILLSDSTHMSISHTSSAVTLPQSLFRGIRCDPPPPHTHTLTMWRLLQNPWFHHKWSYLVECLFRYFTKGPTYPSTHPQTQRKLSLRHINIVHTHWIHAGMRHRSLQFVWLIKNIHVDSVCFVCGSSGVFVNNVYYVCPWHVVQNIAWTYFTRGELVYVGINMINRYITRTG